MAKSLLEQLPGILASARREAEKILEQFEGVNRVSLQTRELVIPSKDTAGLFHADPSFTGVRANPSRLVYGDNLLAMAALLAGDASTPSFRGQLDLVYIDPPYDSKADYRTTITLPTASLTRRPTVIEQFAYSDAWHRGTASYLEMLAPRLILMREFLSATGSLMVHLDWHVGHYVKLLLDEIFGREAFINEIIWRYGKMSNALRRFPQNHDSILFYGRTPDYYFAPVKTADSEYKARFERYLRFNRVHFGDVKHSTDKLILLRTRKIIRELGRELVDEDVLFDFDHEFKTQDDVFYDISIIKGNAAENLSFDTQKPEKLLERLISAACPPGGWVGDFFVGSGTTAAVAERLGRRWIATDFGKPATMITRKRLVDHDAAPFLYQAIGDYQVEHVKSTLGRTRFRVGDLMQTILGIYGALPLPDEQNLNGALGQLPGTRTLVFADSPSRLTTLSTLKRAQGYRDSRMGGFDTVIVLGWNFSASIGQEIAVLGDAGLDVRVIPPDLLSQLKSGRTGSDIKVVFSTLQYLSAHVQSHTRSHDLEELQLRLDNYVLLSPDAIDVDKAGRAKLLEVANSEPLALIEYWAVDPDYDGDVFRSVWQDYRGNTANDSDAMRVVTNAYLSVPAMGAPRRICVRAVDVFGFESEVVLRSEVTA